MTETASMPPEQGELAELRALLRAFVAERDWTRFHQPKNIAMALSVEAAELLEIFQWRAPEHCDAESLGPQKVEHVGEELADVLYYVVSMADALDIDLMQAARRKMEMNRRKHPPGKKAY